MADKCLQTILYRLKPGCLENFIHQRALLVESYQQMAETAALNGFNRILATFNKDDDDDWVIGGGGESGLVGEAGVLEQTNLLNNNGGCPEDIDGNGTVNIDDMLLVLGNYNGTGEGDVDGNGVVNIDDMLLVIGAWNTSC